MMAEVNTIEDGHYVLIKKTHVEEVAKLVKVEKDKTIFFDKRMPRLPFNDIIGHAFGSTFCYDLAAKRLQFVKPEEVQIDRLVAESLMIDGTEEVAEVEERDNRNLIDDSKSQLVTCEEIEKLKQKGLKGEEIMANLIQGSTTFNLKTTFSKEKYLKRKQKKYSNYLTILKPSIRRLAEMYWNQGPVKLNFMRIDTLSQMLEIVNVMDGGRYAVIDSSFGLLTAAVVQRCSPSGKCVQIYTEPGPISTYRQAVDALNLPQDQINDVLYGVQVNQLIRIVQGDNFEEFEGLEESVAKDDIKGGNIKMETEDDSDIGGEEDEREAKKKKRIALRKLEKMRAVNILKDMSMDGVLIAARDHDPCDLIELLYKFLHPSRPFAVFSPMLEPLVACFTRLKNRAVFMNITETWMRRYQVLPQRTRPNMQMSGSGGYLLTGIKVVDEQSASKS